MAILNSTSVVAITRRRLLILLSLGLTWTVAYYMPHYRPLVQASVSSRIHEARQKLPDLWPAWPLVDRSTPPATPYYYNASKIALIIEPRPLPHLAALIVHMMAVVPPEWRFLFIGSPWSTYSVGRVPSIRHRREAGKIDIVSLPRPWSADIGEDVSRLLTDEHFYDTFLPGVEWVFKFEQDSVLCANSPRDLDDWLDWSWAGAPRQEISAVDDYFSGTGGLSLRRVSSIRRVLAFRERHNNSEPEAEWFGKRLALMPGEKVAHQFQGAIAVENVLLEKPMGYTVRGGHGGGGGGGGSYLDHDVWKDADLRNRIFGYCPELSIIMDMKLERERCPDDNGRGGRGTDAGGEAFDLAKLAVEVNSDHYGAQGVGEAALLPPQPPPMPQVLGA
ncbi:MEAB protein [Purpureocillium lavendulum]|uniref:MEAB protein n=1 Tax=Purpureocillium lavendulum TaxID=1247861 RepID=A0AB34G928_9HYPO|nr:MEAB protein [Purpureocillium lavendulum]